jgi:hypothetical protein
MKKDIHYPLGQIIVFYYMGKLQIGVVDYTFNKLQIYGYIYNKSIFYKTILCA